MSKHPLDDFPMRIDAPCFVCTAHKDDRKGLLSAMGKPGLWGRRLARGKDLCPTHQEDLAASLLRSQR